MAMTGGTAKLVHTGYGNGNTNFPIRLYVYYKTSQSVADHKSTISCGMYVVTPSGWDIGQWDDWNSASYVGTTSNTFNGTVPNFSGTRWIAENKTFTVTHDDDGTGEATIRWKWAVNSSWGGFVNPSGSFTITLPTIARVSEPTVSASSVAMGSKVTITTNRKSSSFTHTLKYSFGGTTGNIATGVGASYEWTVPDLASKITNATSGTCTISCITYSGDNNIGTEKVTLTLKVPAATTLAVSQSSVQMGKSLTFTMSRKSSNFTHKLTYSIGDTSGTIGSSLGTSKSWTVPKTLVSDVTNATSGTLSVTCTTYNGTAKVGTSSKSVTVTVPSATVPTFTLDGIEMGALPVPMGDAIVFVLKREASQYTHTLTYKFGSVSGTIGSGIGTSKEWTIPLSLAKEIPSKVNGTVTVTCVTKNGTATVGTKTLDVNVRIDESSETRPNITTFGVSPVHSLPSKFKGIFIQGKSKAKGEFIAESDYSTVSSYKMTIGASTTTGNPNYSGYITSSGTIAVKGTVTDARGFSITKTISATVLPYSSPSIAPVSGQTKVVCDRSKQDGTLSPTGMYLRIRARRNYSKVVSGSVQKNFCAFQYRYKTESAPEYSEWADLIPKSSTSTDTFDGVLNGVVLQTTTSYTVQIKAEDDIEDPEILTYGISAAEIPIHAGEGGKRLGLGQYCNYSEGDPDEGRIDVGWTTFFNTGVGKRVIFDGLGESVGLAEGQTAAEVFSNADTSRVEEYTMFLAVIEVTSGDFTNGVRFPVPCFRVGNRIYGTMSMNAGAEGSNLIRTCVVYFTYSTATTDLTLLRAKFINHNPSDTHSEVSTFDGTKLTGGPMVKALYALL